VNRERREIGADWLIIGGAVALLASLFFTWSHQFSPAFLAEWGSSAQLQGIPHDPTAWQVYSTADVILAVLAVALVLVALRGGGRVRLVALIAAGGALAFTIHALGVPPTNGATIFDASTGRYAPNSPASGAGEVVALVGLGVAMLGLTLSFTAG
jgi:hypothetical protein